ncbi:hypothetical protein B0H14DRAFT_3526802 [Mycena olivaceomarginata]|nr:hypothetical protein B0H14DRAFT_3526802 [Mycena olivaceomarginata]
MTSPSRTAPGDDSPTTPAQSADARIAHHRLRPELARPCRSSVRCGCPAAAATATGKASHDASSMLPRPRMPHMEETAPPPFRLRRALRLRQSLRSLAGFRLGGCHPASQLCWPVSGSALACAWNWIALDRLARGLGLFSLPVFTYRGNWPRGTAPRVGDFARARSPPFLPTTTSSGVVRVHRRRPAAATAVTPGLRTCVTTALLALAAPRAPSAVCGPALCTQSHHDDGACRLSWTTTQSLVRKEDEGIGDGRREGAALAGQNRAAVFTGCGTVSSPHSCNSAISLGGLLTVYRIRHRGVNSLTSHLTGCFCERPALPFPTARSPFLQRASLLRLDHSSGGRLPGAPSAPRLKYALQLCAIGRRRGLLRQRTLPVLDPDHADAAPLPPPSTTAHASGAVNVTSPPATGHSTPLLHCCCRGCDFCRASSGGQPAYSSANDSASRVSRGISGAGFLHQLACKRPRAWYTNGTPSARFGKATACELSTRVRIVRPIDAATRSKTSRRKPILAPARILPCGFIRAGGRHSLDVTPEGRARRTNIRIFGWSGSASLVVSVSDPLRCATLLVNVAGPFCRPASRLLISKPTPVDVCGLLPDDVARHIRNRTQGQCMPRTLSRHWYSVPPHEPRAILPRQATTTSLMRAHAASTDLVRAMLQLVMALNVGDGPLHKPSPCIIN